MCTLSPLPLTAHEPRACVRTLGPEGVRPSVCVRGRDERPERVAKCSPPRDREHCDVRPVSWCRSCAPSLPPRTSRVHASGRPAPSACARPCVRGRDKRARMGGKILPPRGRDHSYVRPVSLCRSCAPPPFPAGAPLDYRASRCGPFAPALAAPAARGPLRAPGFRSVPCDIYRRLGPCVTSDSPTRDLPTRVGLSNHRAHSRSVCNRTNR